MPEQSGNQHQQSTSTQRTGALSNPVTPSRPEPQEASATPLGQQAKAIAGSAVEQAKDVVSAQVTEKSGKGAADIGEVAKALHQTSESLEGNIASPYVKQAAQQLDRVSEFLRTNDVGEMTKKVEAYARREPLLFLGGALAVGLLGARFLKATADRTEGPSK